MNAATTFFDGFAQTFDSFYDGKRSLPMRLIDQQFRSDMFIRFDRTFEAFGDLNGASVLDIGCGSGVYLVEAVRRGAVVTGLDPSPAMLELARQRLESVGSDAQLLAHHFPCPVSPHDFVMVMGVMDYVASPGAFLKALRPVTQRAAALSFPSRHWFRTPFRKARYAMRRCPVYFYTPEQIVELCREAGFGSISVFKIPGAGMDYHVVVRP